MNHAMSNHRNHQPLIPKNAEAVSDPSPPPSEPAGGPATPRHYDPALVRTASVVAARARQSAAQRNSRIRHLKRARAVLHEKYFERITMSDLAKIACLSLHHFCRRYKEHFGKSAAQEQTELRLALADYLLSETSLSMIQISNATGFGSRTTLFRQFIRHYGKSPEEVRLEHRRWQKVLRIGARSATRARSSVAKPNPAFEAGNTPPEVRSHAMPSPMPGVG